MLKFFLLTSDNIRRRSSQTISDVDHHSFVVDLHYFAFNVLEIISLFVLF